MRQGEGGSLDRRAYDHDATSDDDGHFPAQHVAQPNRGHGPKETSQGVSAHRDPLYIGSLRRGPASRWIGGVHFGEILQKRGQRQQSAHYTLDTEVSGALPTEQETQQCDLPDLVLEMGSAGLFEQYMGDDVVA